MCCVSFVLLRKKWFRNPWVDEVYVKAVQEVGDSTVNGYTQIIFPNQRNAIDIEIDWNW